MASENNFEDVLNPEVMRERLISASMFITAFELLRETIIDNIASFYSDGFNENGIILGESYKDKVLSRNKSKLYASIDWLIENNVIDSNDLNEFELIKKARNRLAHELLHAFTKNEDFNITDEFNSLINLLRKIGTWWVVNVEIPTNPDYDGEEIDVEGIVPGPILSIQMMLEVISGNDDLLKKYKEAREKSSKKH